MQVLHQESYRHEIFGNAGMTLITELYTMIAISAFGQNIFLMSLFYIRQVLSYIQVITVTRKKIDNHRQWIGEDTGEIGFTW